jgi:DNA-binding transcriptional MerR regulator
MRVKSVGEVAELAGVTVRTLHHYDELGLLSPSERSGAGYRLYSHDDLERLQEILIWRQLGFSLAEIVSLLDGPGHDRLSALERQRELVGREIDRLGALAAAVDAAIDAQKNGTAIEEASMFEGFDPTEYEDEARERWGDTEAYEESARRAARYGEAEWGSIRSEAEAIVRELATLMRAGEPADGAEARALAERHREHISRWFYPCSPEMHRGLGEMYIADERFTRTYERDAPGLAQYFHDAIVAGAGVADSGDRARVSR